jgi:hypothetical protein
MLSAPLANYISRNYHYKLTMSIGLIFQGGSFLAASWATKVCAPLSIPDKDMATLPHPRIHVWRWHGVFIRLGSSFAKSMVQQTSRAGNGNLCRWLWCRGRPFLHLHKFNDREYIASMVLSNLCNLHLCSQ